MTSYLSLLRGINVGGKSLKMDALRKIYEDRGAERVRTYIQSGNVLFEFSSPEAGVKAFSDRVKSAILKQFKFEVPVLTLKTDRLKDVLNKNPFLKRSNIDPSKLHVTFLASKPNQALVAKLEALPAGKDELCCIADRIYLYCPGGYGETKLSNQTIEKTLSVEATTRNWKTVNALWEMSQNT